MIALYNTAIEALLGMVQKKPAAFETMQQAILNVEIALDRASTEPAHAGETAELLNLRTQLLTAANFADYAQPSQS